MADDEFSKQPGKAFQNVAIGAAGLVGGLPGVTLTVATVGAFNSKLGEQAAASLNAAE